jgi:hypothetical protein
MRQGANGIDGRGVRLAARSPKESLF